MLGWLLVCQPPVPEPLLILALDRTSMLTPGGGVHGGEVVAHHQPLAEVAVSPAQYTLSVLASATDVGGEPGLLEVHLGDELLTTLSIPPGPPRWVSGDVAVSRIGVFSLRLSFANDHHSEAGDRNLIERVRLTRASAAQPLLVGIGRGQGGIAGWRRGSVVMDRVPGSRCKSSARGLRNTNIAI